MACQEKNDLRPAIVFPRLDLSEAFEGGEYWCVDWWTAAATAASTDRDDIDNHADQLAAISYDTLLQTARRCADQISALLDDLPTKDGNFGADVQVQYRQPIVGIAIPEGPLLPLSVLALHMIQLRYYNSTDSLANVPILLPLDPDEPLHRLGQIVEDARPDLVLCATDADAAKMTDAISKVTELTAGIVNFAELSLEAGGKPCKQESGKEDGGDRRMEVTYPWPPIYPEIRAQVVSHICFTSGTSGRSKGCTSSLASLLSYLHAKNLAHGIRTTRIRGSDTRMNDCVVFLASSISFDPCFSDILATFSCRCSAWKDDDACALVGATIAIAPRTRIYSSIATCLGQTGATHVLCTPTLWSTIPVSVGSTNLPCLKVVALGGERVPKRIVKKWARQRDTTSDEPSSSACRQRLLSTYGTTEATIYQTCGEIFVHDTTGDFISSAEVGQDVGLPLSGNIVRVCAVSSDASMVPSSALLDDVVGTGPKDGIGEIVLAGVQLDSLSGYWKRPDLSTGRFVSAKIPENDDVLSTHMHYRTGDLGYLDSGCRLYVVGRIEGEDGMVKINGVRVELGEVESAIVDDDIEQQQQNSSLFDENAKAIGIASTPAVVTGCAVVARSSPSVKGESEADGRVNLIAYCVLSQTCLCELGINRWPPPHQNQMVGYILPPGTALHTLLRVRTASRVRKGCVPSNFVIVSRIPLSKTGKCDRKCLPSTEKCLVLASSKNTAGTDEGGNDQGQLLRERGNAGHLVCKAIASALNLPSSMEASLTSGSNFAALGGDSLAATRVVRSLYASHNSLLDGRNLGGQYGQLEGAFSVKHLLSARALGSYVDWLDSHGACASSDLPVHLEAKEDTSRVIYYEEKDNAVMEDSGKESDDDILYDALVESTTTGLSTVASHLLKAGADPNFAQRTKDERLGKISDKRKRRAIFRSTPLHFACIKGDDTLVAALVKHGAKSKVPDAGGGLPLLLNCSGKDDTYGEEEDERRLRIARLLLEYGSVPLSAKDANRQTVLHATARSGHPKLLRYLMSSWKKAGDEGKIHIYPPGIKGGRYDWQDRWFRTPVHWAVLNGNVEALRILLEGGCSPNPSRPKASIVNRKTSAAVESPLEICERLYGFDSGKGKLIQNLLNAQQDGDSEVS